MAFSFDPSTTSIAPPSAGPASMAPASRDARALKILAKTMHRELRQSGLAAEDVLHIAAEMLRLVADDVRDRRRTS